MTDPREPTAIAPAPDDSAGAPPASISRRMLLRGASVAAPTILTLNSTAAVGWAIASGTIGTTRPTGGTGPAICLDKTTVGSEVKTGVYLIPDRYAEVVDVPNTLYYRRRGDNWTGSKTTIRPEQVCSEGGYIEYSYTGGTGNTNWTKLKARVDSTRYPLVSSTAVNSFGDRVFRKDITTL